MSQRDAGDVPPSQPLSMSDLGASLPPGGAAGTHTPRSLCLCLRSSLFVLIICVGFVSPFALRCLF